MPDFVTEVWTIDIALADGYKYLPELNDKLKAEWDHYSEVKLSRALSHPVNFNLKDFSRIPAHDFEKKPYGITFVWREDRLWMNENLFKWLLRFRLRKFAHYLQRKKIISFFAGIRNKFSDVRFAVAGIGTGGSFPDWIVDKRVGCYNDENEKISCELYSESRLVIGLHGSNMLLPSGHAGFAISLMPVIRWGNAGQDILYQEENPKKASYRYRFLPCEINVSQLIQICLQQIKGWDGFIKHLNLNFS